MRWFPGSSPTLLFCELTWNFPAALTGSYAHCLAELFTFCLLVVFCPSAPSSVTGPLENLLMGEKCYCWCFLAWCNLEDFIKCILCNFSPLSPRLSAFVLRCFLEADPYIDIDQNVLHRTYTWLKGHQKSNGEFWEPGRVIHSELQGGNKSPVTLTAYIVTSLLGYKKYQVFNI